MTVTTSATPQNIAALEKANEVKNAQEAERRRIRNLCTATARERVARLLDDPPKHVSRMRVGLLLRSCPGVGPLKVTHWLNRAGVRSSDRRVEEMTDRQRELVAAILRGEA